MNVKKMINDFYNDESGVTAVEYAIVIAGVAAVCLVIFNTTDGPVYNMLTTVFSSLETTLTGLVGGNGGGANP